MRLLIVDDHQLFAQSLARLIIGHDGDAKVAVAASVGEAGAALEQFGPELVLVDWHLGDGRGNDVISLVRRDVPSAKVIVLTGSTEPAVVRAAMAAGCDGFVTKDRAADELFEAMRAARSGQMVVSPAATAVAVGQLDAPEERITDREVEIIAALARGLSNAEIAGELFLSPHTVRNHIQRVAGKLGVSTRLEIAMAALRRGLIEVPAGR